MDRERMVLRLTPTAKRSLKIEAARRGTSASALVERLTAEFLDRLDTDDKPAA